MHELKRIKIWNNKNVQFFHRWVGPCPIDPFMWQASSLHSQSQLGWTWTFCPGVCSVQLGCKLNSPKNQSHSKLATKPVFTTFSPIQYHLFIYLHSTYFLPCLAPFLLSVFRVLSFSLSLFRIVVEVSWWNWDYTLVEHWNERDDQRVDNGCISLPILWSNLESHSHLKVTKWYQ